MAYIIEERDLEMKLQREYRRGIEDGIRLLKEHLLLCTEKGTPVELDGRAWFLRSDIQNLRDIFDDLESEA